MADFEVRAAALSVIDTGDEALALATTGACIPKKEGAFAIRAATGRSARACLAGMEKGTVFIHLARRGTCAFDTSASFSQAIAVLAALEAAAAIADRRREWTFAIHRAARPLIDAQSPLTCPIALTERAECYAIVRIRLACLLVQITACIRHKIGAAICVLPALHAVALPAGHAQANVAGNADLAYAGKIGRAVIASSTTFTDGTTLI